LRHPKVIDAIDHLRQVMNEEIVRQQALRASPPSESKTPRQGPDGTEPPSTAAVLVTGCELRR
jgi:hypothetical protein